MNFVSKKLSILLIFHFSLSTAAHAMDKNDSSEADAGYIEWSYMRGTFKRLAVLQKEGNLDVLATVGIRDNFNRIRRQFKNLEKEKEEITKNIESEVIEIKKEFMECLERKKLLATRWASKSTTGSDIEECQTEVDESMNKFHLAMRKCCPRFYELPTSPLGDQNSGMWPLESAYTSTIRETIAELEKEGKLGLDQKVRTLCNFNRADAKVGLIKSEINDLRKTLLYSDLIFSQRNCLKNLPRIGLRDRVEGIEECWSKKTSPKPPEENLSQI